MVDACLISAYVGGIVAMILDDLESTVSVTTLSLFNKLVWPVSACAFIIMRLEEYYKGPK